MTPREQEATLKRISARNQERRSKIGGASAVGGAPQSADEAD